MPKRQQGERSVWDDPFGEQLEGVVLSGPYRKAPSNASERNDAESRADPPREFQEEFAQRIVLAAHRLNGGRQGETLASGERPD